MLLKQLLRAATSVGANVVEASGSGSKRDFVHFYTIALKSARETLYWLYLIRESGKGNLPTVDQLLDEATQLTKMLAASILTATGKR